MITTFLIGFPLLAALFVYLSGNKLAGKVAVIASLLELAAGISAFLDFNPIIIWNFEQRIEWISNLNIEYYVGMDGISLVLVLLTVLLLPVILITGLLSKLKDTAAFYSLALLMQSALIGVFTAKDVFLFYIFWELALLPIYFICLQWGDENRKATTFKFFIYTLVGSLFMLVAIIYLYLQTPDHSYSMESLYSLRLDSIDQTFVFLAFVLAFGIKMPIFPLHTWQPATYTSAPTAGTMLLSGIMLKMGIYGVIRWVIPITPIALESYGCWVIIAAVIGILYSSILALQQQNYKTLIAYVSIAHVGLIAAGVFSASFIGIQASLIQMFAHGINVVGIFLIIELIVKRTGTLELSKLGGLRHQAPILNVFFLIIVMASIALPLTNGFVGEFMLFVALFQYSPILTAIAGLTIILGAVYMLSSFQKIMLGDVNPNYSHVQDVTLGEALTLVPLIALIIIMGIFPNIVLEQTEASVEMLLQSMQKTVSSIN
ncbi:MAG: NADH-quinone oxidoreductase subunit M [Cytophagaceae bacterium]|jgi:NADH-quinone oxidoreductase subunit M|nr:NADH-quinone oxidoreductase subunit M [Cytophagaceae bacterium]